MKKVVVLIASVLAIICGIVILVISFADIEMPKVFWLIYTLCMIVVSCVNISTYLKTRKD